MDRIKVSIVYPTDPVGTIPGGIDTCIRGILKWAPDDISMSLIGVTTDRVLRPVGQWTSCSIERKEFRLFPVLALDTPGKQMRIPLSLRFTTALAVKSVRHKYHVLQFHRIEPSLVYLLDRTPKIAFIHQNVGVLDNKKTDIRWKYLPWLYYNFEDLLLTRSHSLFVVSEDALSEYKKRYPEIVDKFQFLPTWMDPDIFYPPDKNIRDSLRSRFLKHFEKGKEHVVLVYVGRLDHSKDPLFLIDAFSEVVSEHPNVRLIMIGDGVLRSAVALRIRYHGLNNKVALTGLLPAPEVANYLRASDLLVLSSAYECMPRAVVEAMGCGLPVVATDVGEVRRLVKPGVNGEIASKRTIEDFSSAVISCIKNLEKYRGKPCLNIAAQYVPEKVLAPVYEHYRRLTKKKDFEA